MGKLITINYAFAEFENNFINTGQAVYEEKDRAQELLIEELNHALQLFADGVSDKKAGWKGKRRGGRMNDQQYFQSTSLSYRLKAAERELEALCSGEAYVKLRAEYEGVIRSQNAAIKRLQKERDSFSFSRKEIMRQWMDVLEDVQKEHDFTAMVLTIRNAWCISSVTSGTA